MVPFSPAASADPSLAARQLLPWLKAITALLALLLLGLAVGAAMLLHAAGTMTQALAPQGGGAAAAAERAELLVREVSERQRDVSDALRARSERLHPALVELQHRRSTLEPVAKGPLEKLGQMLLLMQLLSDQMNLMISQLQTVQDALERGVRPLPSQVALLPADGGDHATPPSDAERGTGGSAKAPQDTPPADPHPIGSAPGTSGNRNR